MLVIYSLLLVALLLVTCRLQPVYPYAVLLAVLPHAASGNEQGGQQVTGSKLQPTMWQTLRRQDQDSSKR